MKLIDIADKATEAGLEINGRVALAKAISTLVSSYASTLLTNDADESKVCVFFCDLYCNNVKKEIQIYLTFYMYWVFVLYVLLARC